jgi:hypothetical protein
MDVALDGAPSPGLPHDWQARLEGHVAACPRCRRQWDLLRAADAALRAPQPVPAPVDLLPEFRRRLAGPERPAPARGWLHWLWPVGGLAAAGAAAALAFAVMPRTPAPHPELMARQMPAPLEPPPAAMSVPDSAGGGTAAPASVPPAAEGRSAPPAAGAAAPPLSLDALAPKGKPRADRRLNVAEAPPAAPAVVPGGPAPLRDEARLDNSGRSTGKPADTQAFYAKGGPARQSAPAQSGGGFGGIAGGQSQDALAAGIGQQQQAQGPQAQGPQAQGDQVRLGFSTPGLSGVSQQQTTELLSQVYAEAPELNVSPAVLSALQRPVEVRFEQAPVREVVRRLAEAADVPMRVDSSVAQLRVSLQEEQVPLWQALEIVALQGNFQILPEDNRLVLKLVAQRGVKKEAAAGPAPAAAPVRAPAEPAVRARSAQKPQNEPAPTRLRQAIPAPRPGVPPPPATRQARVVREELQRQPNRAVWPEAWGTLPERGFVAPDAAELAASLAEDQLRNAPAAGGGAPAPAPARPPNRR